MFWLIEPALSGSVAGYVKIKTGDFTQNFTGGIFGQILFQVKLTKLTQTRFVLYQIWVFIANEKHI